MPQSEVTKDGSKKPSLKSLAESLTPASWKALDQETRFLLSVYLRWENTARVSCGTVFIPQSLRSDPNPTPSLSSPTDISSKRL